MIDLDYSFFIQLVNFIITLVVLNILLIDPIRKIIKKRQEVMAEKLGKIEQFTGQAEGKVKDYQAALDEARRQGVDVRKQKKKRARPRSTRSCLSPARRPPPR